MKILKIHLAEIVVAMLFILFGYCLSIGSAQKTNDSESIPYNQDWVCFHEGNQTAYACLPKRISLSDGSGRITLQKNLDSNSLYSNTISFYSSHQFITAFLDGEEIYRLQVPKGMPSKTPGNCWNFIRLPKDHAGKLLEIRIQNAYHSQNVRMPDFILGTKSDIIMGQVREKTLALIISMVLLMTGLMLSISWFSIGKKLHFHEGTPWIGLFSIQFSIWSAFETGIPMILFGREILCGQIMYISLKLILLPLLCSIQVFYQMEENRIFNLLVRLAALDFAISLAGQSFGWFDFRQAMWVTHILALLSAAAALFFGLKLLAKKGGKLFSDKQKFFLNLIGILLAIGCTLADAWNYIFHACPDGAIFSRYGCLAFVLIQVFQFLKDSAKLIAAGQEAETLREEAKMDGLTMMKNRRAFETSLHQIKPERYGSYSFVVFDLNNLKKMNDTYGHGMGDCYIITASEVIRDLFGEFGEIYRIGGDEFCLVSDCITQEVFIEKEQGMSHWIENLQGSQVKDFMQIASGFAAFNKSKDMNLQDTIERADAKMYQKKQEQKNERR